MSKPTDSAVIRWAMAESEIDRREPGWATVAELAAAAGIDNHKMDLRAKRALHLGVLERKRIRIVDGNGRTARVFVYRAVEVPNGEASTDRTGTGTHGGGDHQRTRNCRNGVGGG